ncbi:hypothetical protein TorRG33x02_120540 [Trema orientale]|uniref:Uncharacterized protein n=1 Tax=Trema orientale TaxID=63057 RepID=A0A2P5F361_TREOI|nr:hypothetical protein TorRG33x02_120540 [Trema orientale]
MAQLSSPFPLAATPLRPLNSSMLYLHHAWKNLSSQSYRGGVEVHHHDHGQRLDFFVQVSALGNDILENVEYDVLN